MKQLYTIGDIVKVAGNENIYIVSQYFDFSYDFSYEGKRDNYVSNYVYELLQIYPINKTLPHLIRNEEDLSIIHLNDSPERDKVLHIIITERERKGLFDKKYFLNSIFQNQKQRESEEKMNENSENEPKKKRDDIIYYGKIKTIDDCLDAMNDLDDLHKAFGDEEYLKLRNKVVKRIHDLVKK